jgi:defect-in-organelle-trafficking protein DotB
LNATPTRTSRRDGGNLVLRPIPDLPPPLAEQLVEPGILEAYGPRQGMVIVSGATGCGKSTLRRHDGRQADGPGGPLQHR